MRSAHKGVGSLHFCLTVACGRTPNFSSFQWHNIVGVFLFEKDLVQECSRLLLISRALQTSWSPNMDPARSPRYRSSFGTAPGPSHRQQLYQAVQAAGGWFNYLMGNSLQISDEPPSNNVASYLWMWRPCDSMCMRHLARGCDFAAVVGATLQFKWRICVTVVGLNEFPFRRLSRRIGWFSPTLRTRHTPTRPIRDPLIV